MTTNRYIQDFLFTERQQERLHDAACQRQVRQATLSTTRYSGMRHIVGRFGSVLVTIGTRMERVEQRKPAFVSHR